MIGRPRKLCRQAFQRNSLFSAQPTLEGPIGRFEGSYDSWDEPSNILWDELSNGMRQKGPPAPQQKNEPATVRICNARTGRSGSSVNERQHTIKEPLMRIPRAAEPEKGPGTSRSRTTRLRKSEKEQREGEERKSASEDLQRFLRRTRVRILLLPGGASLGNVTL